MNRSKKFWNLLAKNYDKQVSKNYGDAYKNTIVLSRRFLKPNQVVLDYACGTGITTVELSKNVRKIYAIDIAEKMIEKARQKSNNRNIKNIDFKVADLSDIEKTGTKFDVVFAFNILYFAKDIKKSLCQINNLLLPSGIFLSATDCFGEKKNLKIFISIILSKFGLMPFMASYKTKELENVIKESGFKIIKTQNLYDGTPANYFIAAEKIN